MSENGSDRVQPRPLHWANSNDPIGQALQRLVRKLVDIRSGSPALRGPLFYPERYEPFFNDQGYGLDTDKDVVIYHRWAEKPGGGLQRFIVVLNCSAYDQWVDIPFSADGVWHDALNDRSDQVTGFWLRNQQISSNWGRVYSLDTP